jgi:hypothetical protein
MVENVDGSEESWPPRWPRILSAGPHPNEAVAALIGGVVVLLLAGILAAVFFPSASIPSSSGGFVPGATRLFLRIRAAQRDLQWVSGANLASATMLAIAALILAVAAPVRDHTRDSSARACTAVAGLALLVALGAVAAMVIDLTHRVNQPTSLVIRQLAEPVATGVVSLAVLWWVEAIAAHPEPEVTPVGEKPA